MNRITSKEGTRFDTYYGLVSDQRYGSDHCSTDYKKVLSFYLSDEVIFEHTTFVTTNQQHLNLIADSPRPEGPSILAMQVWGSHADLQARDKQVNFTLLVPVLRGYLRAQN